MGLGGGTAGPDPGCTCPFPVPGVYDTLDTVELLAMGMKIPPTIHQELLTDARRSPGPRGRRVTWGRRWATEVYRRADDGSDLDLVRAHMGDDPYSPVGDEGNFPLV